jgi:ferredoxin
MDIPLMLRDIGDGDLKHAIATIKRDIALPAVLGRICTKPCEKGCRRRDADGPVAVCELKRIAADQDLKQQHPFAPECLPDSGKRVAIIGAGPCGLSAAYYLRQRGHHCLLTERESLAGGRMRTETNEDVLPREVLDAEINQILRLGIELKTDGAVTTQEEFDRLCKGHDALLVACGAASADQTETWGLKGSRKGVYTDRETYRTGRTGVFAAGCAVRGKALFVRSAADGKEVAQCIDQFLSGQEIQGPTKPFSSRMGKIDTDELNQFVSLADAGATDHPSGDGRDQSDQANEQTSEQADRCLACGCVAHGHCQLERYASQYQADPNRFGPRHRSFEIMGREGNVLFEPGKCIKCELCIQIAAASGNALGLSFVGHGFDVRVGVPFHESFDAGVAEVAAECIAACPTGAIYFNHRRQQIHSLDEASN